MSSLYPQALSRVISDFAKLPGIGHKSAQRLAFYLLEKGIGESNELAEALLDLPKKIHFCPRCFNIAEDELCRVCADEQRDETTICVVESPRDVIPIEKSGSYRGQYHILGGVLSPLDSVGPEELNIKPLLERLKERETNEVILAIGSNVEGEATASYLAELLKPLGVKITRIAQGLPVGGDLEYTDEVTLMRAFEGRRSL